MVVPVPHPAALHPLTPGSPAYALLKVGAVGGVIALRFALARRGRAQEEEAPAPAAPPTKKKRRRRR
jgi:hypothetical protein